MALGAQTARQNQFVTIPEVTPGVLDPLGVPTARIDVNTDGNGFEEVSRFIEHLPDGFNELLGAALVGREGTVAGNFMPHYASTPELLDYVCGARATTTLADGRTQHRWKLPEKGRVNRKTFSGFYGTDTDAVQLLYGKVQKFSIESARGGEVGGNVTFHFNRVKRAQNIPGSVMQNKTINIIAAAVTTGVAILFAATNLGAGGTVNVVQGETAATLLPKIKALPGYNDAGVTTTGGPIPSASASVTVSGAGLNDFNGIYSATGATQSGAPVYSKDSTHWLGYNGGQWILAGSQASTAATPSSIPYYVNGAPTTVPTTGWSIGGAPGTVGPVPTTTSSAGGAVSGALGVILGGAIGNRPQPTPTIPTPVAGWSVASVQQGSDGSGALVPTGPYIEVTHGLVYKATDYTDLQTINMGNATTPAPLTDTHIVATAQAHGVTLDALVEPVWYEDRTLEAASHADGATTVTDTITLPKDSDGRCEEIYATENEGGCGVIPFYLRHAYRCGQRELWIDLFGGRNQQPAHPVDNNIAQRQFQRRRFYNPNGSVIFTIIEPAP